jgi:hypothetical protein
MKVKIRSFCTRYIVTIHWNWVCVEAESLTSRIYNGIEFYPGRDIRDGPFMKLPSILMAWIAYEYETWTHVEL